MCEAGARCQVPGTRQGADLPKPGSSAPVPCAAAAVTHTCALPSCPEGGSCPSAALPFFPLLWVVLAHRLGAWYALGELHLRSAPKGPPGNPVRETVPYLKNSPIRFSCYKKHKIYAFPSRPPLSTLSSRMEHIPLLGNRSPGLFLPLNLTLRPLNFIFLNSVIPSISPANHKHLSMAPRERSLPPTHEETEAGNGR